MSKHTTYRGTSIDMDAMRRENEHVVAMGNGNVNAKGDLLARGGAIAKTADQIARENHRVLSTLSHGSLKERLPENAIEDVLKPAVTPTPTPTPTPVKATVRKIKETELPSGDIVIGEDDAS